MKCNTTATCLQKDASSIISSIENIHSRLFNGFSTNLLTADSTLSRILVMTSSHVISFGIGMILFDIKKEGKCGIYYSPIVQEQFQKKLLSKK